MLRKRHKHFYLVDQKQSFHARIKDKITGSRPVPSFPEDVQIQTVTGCNASCAFCPNGKTCRQLPSGSMDSSLFRKIIDECLQNPVKRISPYLMNEPLRDRNLPEKIRYIAERKPPGLSIKINTNASLLTAKTARAIIGSNLDRLNISFHGISKETYERSMQGLRYEQVLSNINTFLETKSMMGADRPAVAVTMVKTTLIEPEIQRIRQYWDDKGVEVHIQPLENRTARSITEKGLNTGTWHPHRWCKRLFTQAYILHSGDMVLCCADWEQTTILGNVRNMSIEEVWNGEKARAVRQRFLSGDTEGLPCHSCLKQRRNS